MESNISAKPADPELKRYLPSIPNGVKLQKPVKVRSKGCEILRFTYVQLKRINDKNAL